MRMADPANERPQSPVDYKSIREQSGFWSACGYDGLSIVFDIPIEAFRSLSEPQKHALMRLFSYPAEEHEDGLNEQIQALATLTEKERFIALVELSTGFAV